MARSKKLVRERNEQLAEMINQDALANPDSPYMGKFIAIANGEIVAIGDDKDVEELIGKLRNAEPDSEKRLLFEVGIDYDEPVQIWSLG